MRFVLVTLFLNAMAFGIIIPVTPELVTRLSGATLAQATAIGGMLSVTFAAFQFLFSPIVGNLSDRFGRRPVLLLSLAGFSVDFLILALAPTLAWLFVARALTGICGSSNGPAQSVVADITPPDGRSRRFGLIGAAFGMGFVAGPAVGGVLGEFGYRLPFYAAAALAFANFLYGWFTFEETLDHANRRPFRWARANPVGALLAIRALPGLAGIATVYFLWQLASLIYPMIWSYYSADRYGWSPGLIGLSLALMGVAMALMQIFAAKRIIARFGDRRTAEIGLIGAIAVMVAVALVADGRVVLALMPVVAVQSLVHPCLTAMMSRRATPQTQGEMQGFASGAMAVGSILAPLIYNPLYAWFAGPAAPFTFDGIAFAVSAAIATLALLILTRLPRAQR